MSAAAVSGSIATRAGAVHYVRAGRGAPLILMHGNGHSWREFADVIEPLAAHYDVIAWDMPGQGASADAPAGLTVSDYAAALSDLIDGLALQRPALLGSSIGAFIAAAAAVARRDIPAVILEEMQLRTRDWWVAAWPIVERMFGQTMQTHEQVQARFNRRVDAALLREWNEGRERAGAERLIGVMAAIRDFPLRDTLSRLTTPSLLLYGEEGPTIETAEETRAIAPAAEMGVVKRAGHFVSLDQPTAFAENVVDFLSKIARADAPARSA